MYSPLERMLKELRKALPSVKPEKRNSLLSTPITAASSPGEYGLGNQWSQELSPLEEIKLRRSSRAVSRARSADRSSDESWRPHRLTRLNFQPSSSEDSDNTAPTGRILTDRSLLLKPSNIWF